MKRVGGAPKGWRIARGYPARGKSSPIEVSRHVNEDTLSR